jgi:hypothetical protein
MRMGLHSPGARVSDVGRRQADAPAASFANRYEQCTDEDVYPVLLSESGGGDGVALLSVATRYLDRDDEIRSAPGLEAGGERPLPRGSLSPGPRHGNFGVGHWSSTPVGSHPAGVSAWEWAETAFAPVFAEFRCVRSD